jgi:transcriptional regulator with XRE-family HTH domain
MHLKGWRQRRRLSQLDLATEANISARHLSFVETGRSVPSREMILHLAEELQIPMRQRNVLLVAAGYAPIFQERSLDHPALSAAREAIDGSKSIQVRRMGSCTPTWTDCTAMCRVLSGRRSLAARASFRRIVSS